MTRSLIDDTLELSVVLRIQNNNGFRIRLDALEYRLFLDAREIGGGAYPKSGKPLSVEAHSEDRFSMPVKVSVGVTTVELLDGLLQRQDDYFFRVRAMLTGKFGSIPVNLLLKRSGLVLDRGKG